MDVVDLARRVSGSLRGAGLCTGTLRVGGEVASMKESANGHLFFNLKSGAAGADVFLRCVMWSSARRGREARLAPPADGDRVVLRGAVSLYQKWTEVKFRVSGIERTEEGAGAGEMERRLRETTGRLDADGLLCRRRRPVVAAVVRRVAVVTSRSGAALQDFLRIVGARAPGLEVVVHDARVQGDVGESLAAAIRRADAEARADVLVLTRGGGDAQDLWCFNDEAVARALAACATPTVSAVGHATDRTLVDRVSDVAVATPSEAAVRVTTDSAFELAAARARLAAAERAVQTHRRAKIHTIELRQTRLKHDVRNRVRAMERGMREIDALVALRAAVELRLGDNPRGRNSGGRWRLYVDGGPMAVTTRSCEDEFRPGARIEARCGSVRARLRIAEATVERDEGPVSPGGFAEAFERAKAGPVPRFLEEPFDPAELERWIADLRKPHVVINTAADDFASEAGALYARARAEHTWLTTGPGWNPACGAAIDLDTALLGASEELAFADLARNVASAATPIEALRASVELVRRCEESEGDPESPHPFVATLGRLVAARTALAERCEALAARSKEQGIRVTHV